MSGLPVGSAKEALDYLVVPLVRPLPVDDVLGVA